MQEDNKTVTVKLTPREIDLVCDLLLEARENAVKATRMSQQEFRSYLKSIKREELFTAFEKLNVSY